MDAAIKQAEQDEEDSSSSSSASDSDSSESSFALKKAEKEKKKPKAKAKAKGQGGKKPVVPKSEDVDQVPSGAPTITSPAPLSEKSSAAASVAEKPVTLEVLMDRANASLLAIKGLTAWTLYNGAKTKDVDTKIAKCLDIVSKIENRPPPADNALVTIAENLTAEMDRVSQQSDLFAKLSVAEDVAQTLRGSSDQILEIVKGWSQEESSSFLNDLGRKTCDAFLGSSGKDPVFFGFLTTATMDDWDGFSIKMVKELMQEDQDYYEMLVAQVQQNALNYFMDRLRSVAKTESSAKNLLQSFPKTWYMPELCRTHGGAGARFVKRMEHIICLCDG